MSKLYAAKFPDGSIKTYTTWTDCSREVTGVKGVLYKSFKSREDMNRWLSFDTSSHIDDGTGIRVYVDGSYSRNRNRASWAFVVIDGDSIIHEASGIVPHPPLSNNIDGECYAAMNAILWAATAKVKAKIIHDYVGISAWLTGEFKATTDIAKMYVSRCKMYIDNIEFVKVKGHTGNKWNEYVDEMAKRKNNE